MIECPHCKKCYKPLGIAAHIRLKHTDFGKIFLQKSIESKIGLDPWNKGLSKDTDDRVKKSSEKISKSLVGKCSGRASTEKAEEDRKMKISNKMKIVGGGYRQGSGRGKKGWYKGFFCDSSYELAYLIYSLDNSIPIKRNTEKREYEFEGRIRNYIPDFIINEKIIEIKGYKSLQWEAKLKANPDIEVLYEKDLKHVFEYVIDKYGENFIDLYEVK